jgi:hypothetical protein
MVTLFSDPKGGSWLHGDQTASEVVLGSVMGQLRAKS